MFRSREVIDSKNKVLAISDKVNLLHFIHISSSSTNTHFINAHYRPKQNLNGAIVRNRELISGISLDYNVCVE